MGLDPIRFQALFKAGHYFELLQDESSSLDIVSNVADPRRQLCTAQAMIHADRIDDALYIIGRNRRSQDRLIAAQCELLLGLIAKRHAALDDAVRHFQSAVRMAREGRANDVAAWACLHLFRLLAEIASPHEMSALLAEARRLVIDVGDPHLSSYLHESVALREAQMGRLYEAKRHLRLAEAILEMNPNAWIEQLLHMSAFCVAFLECDFGTAAAQVAKARTLRKVTGPSYQDPIIDANESYLRLCTGKLAAALPTLQRLSGHHRAQVQIGSLDTLARLYLSLNQIELCGRALNALASAGHTYSNFHNVRWAACTELSMLVRKDPSLAADAAAARLEHAKQISDTPLTNALLLIRAEALASIGRLAESGLTLLEASQSGVLTYHDQRGDFYESCGTTLLSAGATEFGKSLRQRAIRLWRSEGRILPQLAVLSRLKAGLPVENYTQVALDQLFSDTPIGKSVSIRSEQSLLVADAIAAAFDLAESPRLAAIELMNAAVALGCDDYLAARPEQRVRNVAAPMPLLTVRGNPTTPVLSITVANMLRLGDSVSELARLREAERTRAALWPCEEELPEAENFFVSPEMTSLASIARKVAPTTVPVLITGETGTGKEILARAIHAASARAKATFLPFNCSSGPRDTIDAQLFGHRRGAFTGAIEHAPGVVRAAAGGTLFLDEIGESPLEVQTKLLRFLESGEIHPLGEPHPMKVDVRVIAATNVDLDAAVSSGRFREDLFYRLNIVRLHLPPVRERRVEIPVFAQHYLRKYAQELGKGDLRLAEETMEYLLLYRWPGNVRQVANEMRRMATLAEADAVLMPEHLSPEIVASRRTVPASQRSLDANEVVVRLDQPLAAAAEHLERAMIPYALKQCGGRVEDAARRLGLSRKGLYLKRMRLGLEPRVSQARSA